MKLSKSTQQKFFDLGRTAFQELAGSIKCEEVKDTDIVHIDSKMKVREIPIDALKAFFDGVRNNLLQTCHEASDIETVLSLIESMHDDLVDLETTIKQQERDGHDE